MAQHDYDLANASGASFRADLNDALDAIVSQNSGASAPTTTFAYQLWADTTNDLLKIRNAANSAWISLLKLSTGRLVAATTVSGQTAETAPATDDEMLIGDTSAGDIRKMTLANLLKVINSLTADASPDTAADYVMTYDVSASAVKKVLLSALASGGITLGTEQASTSGTSRDFTGIPAGTKRITISFVGVSVDGAADLLVQLGDSGGVETSGYLGSGSWVGAGVSSSNFTAGFGVGKGCVAASVVHGTTTLTLEDASDNTWTCSSILSFSDSAYTLLAAGSKSLSAALDRVRITTVAGTAAFDAGSINIAYQ